MAFVSYEQHLHVHVSKFPLVELDLYIHFFVVHVLYVSPYKYTVYMAMPAVQYTELYCTVLCNAIQWH